MQILLEKFHRAICMMSSIQNQSNSSFPHPPVSWNTGFRISPAVCCFLESRCAIYVALEQNRDDPEGALYQDARLFSALQQQAIWRNLSLCKRLHDEILFSAPRVNMLWHRYKRGLPHQSRFSPQEVSETFTATWKERSSDIKHYQLPAFAITGFGAVLQILEHKGQLANPALLMDEGWHKSMYQLTRSFQHSLDTFYIVT